MSGLKAGDWGKKRRDMLKIWLLFVSPTLILLCVDHFG